MRARAWVRWGRCPCGCTESALRQVSGKNVNGRIVGGQTLLPLVQPAYLPPASALAGAVLTAQTMPDPQRTVAEVRAQYQRMLQASAASAQSAVDRARAASMHGNAGVAHQQFASTDSASRSMAASQQATAAAIAGIAQQVTSTALDDQGALARGRVVCRLLALTSGWP